MSGPPPEPVRTPPFEKPRAYVSRLVIKLGKPSGPEYSVEITFPVAPTADEFEKARKAALHDIRGWLDEKEVVKPLTVEDVNKLPWRDYQKKEPVSPEHDGWVMWERDGGGELARAIDEASEKKLKLGPYEFVFSGKEKQFIGRKVVEPTQKQNGAPQ
jgi:hypothetical protein